MSSTKKAARFAGWLYLLGGLPAPFSLLYLPRKLFVPKDAAATARNILANESLLRLSIVVELYCAVTIIFIAFALYRLFEGVDRRQAALMVTLFVVSVPITFVNVVNDIAALILARGADVLTVFDRRQLDALAMFFMRLHGQGVGVAAIFWGLWLIPFGMLVYRSGFLPRVLGVLLIANGLAYPIQSLTTLLLPEYREAVWRATLPFLFGELAIILWLVIRGARDQPLAEASA